MSETESKKPIGSATAETILVEKEFRKLKVGDSVTYEQVNAKMPGLDIQGRHRGYAMTAIRRCEADSIFIRCIPKEGWMRVDDAKAVDLTDDNIKRTGRILRKTSNTLARVDFDTLDREHKRKHQVNLAVAGTMAMFAKPKSIQKIEGKMNGGQIKPSTEEILKLFDK